MTFIKIHEHCDVECRKVDNQYQFFFKENDEVHAIGRHQKSPLEHSKSTQIGKQIYNQITKNENLALRRGESWDDLYLKEFNKILEELDSDLKQQEKSRLKQIKEEQEELETKYKHYYSKFQSKCEELNYTPLEYILRICEALGVDAQLELMKSFLGDLQTLLGLKGTNVIAIGGQSSGKTHCIETPHSMLLEEFIHDGVLSKAAFFKRYNGQDLTGHIFYFGDLGGEKDDENTIAMRDIFKRLTTDGIARRGLMDTNENVDTDEVVTGFPAISYTTVHEDIINEQEKSRSIIIYPPEVDQRKLMIYDSFIEAPGADIDLKIDIEESKLLVKGYVWHLKETIGSFELFNPYMFVVQYFLRDMPDFNRKIKEFNTVLRLVCILKNSFSLTHNIYHDDDYNSVETTVLIATKEDVIDALTLFEGSTGLLPTELGLAKGLIKKYDEVPIDLDHTLDDESDIDYEKMVKELFQKKMNPDVRVGGVDLDNITKWDGFEDDEGVTLDCFFTVKDLRKNHRTQRWYREVSNTLGQRLDKLYNYGVLIKIGKTEDGQNIYALNYRINEKINDAKPMFRKKDVDMGIDEFHRKYPELIKEFDEFIKKDKALKISGTNFEIKKGTHLFDLPWNKDGLK